MARLQEQPVLREFLQSAVAFLHQSSEEATVLLVFWEEAVVNLLEARNLPMPHAYRRFFATIRDAAGMNPGALKKILGHSKGVDVTARYSRAADDIAFLRSEMDRCPLGFSLPAYAEPQRAERQETIEAIA